MSASAAYRTPLFRAALFVALFLSVLGSKLILIERFGSDLPYWDQWNGVIEHLLIARTDGTLQLADFFSPHNEHRPLFMRLLSMGAATLNDGQFDGRLEMILSSSLHALVALLLLGICFRLFPPALAASCALPIGIFFGTWASWENVLSGFQSQFYFMVGFTLLHQAGTFLAPVQSWRWRLAPLAGAAAFFGVASGLLSTIAVVAITGARAARDRRLSVGDGYVLSANGVIAVVCWWLINPTPDHDVLKAASLGAWIPAWLHQLAWPNATSGHAWFALAGLLPPLLLLAAWWRRRIDGPAAMMLLSLNAWATLQTMAIAYSRGGEMLGEASRYGDVLAIAVIARLAALCHLAQTAVRPRERLAWSVAVAGLAGLAIAGISARGTAAIPALAGQPSINQARIQNVRSYLIDRDPAFFDRAPWSELPFPSAPYLASILDQPAAVSVLPSAVRPPLELVPETAEGFSVADAAFEGPPSPDGRQFWSAPDGTPARFLSQPFLGDHSRVTIFVSGTSSAAATQLRLLDPDGVAHSPLDVHLAFSDGRWTTVNFSAPEGLHQLEVTKETAGNFAFTQPSTETSLSNEAEDFVRLGPWLLGTGVVAGLASLAGLFLVGRMGATP